MHSFSRRRIAVVGGGLAGLEFAVAAAKGGATVEVFEAGPQTRTRHVNWDTTQHAGDQKVRSWTSDNWGAGGGLSERLGGRSLCYHGVLIGLEPSALAKWNSVWIERFAGELGLYRSILDELRAEFPELEAENWPPHLAAIGLHHVPQAARIDEFGRFEAYSALARTFELVADGRLRVNRVRVRAVVPKSENCRVEIESSTESKLHRGFDSCVLAASAIGNAQILAASLKRDIVTQVTDHFCVGGFVRLPKGPALAPFRHRMLWSGFVPVPELNMNLFFLERPPLPTGDRIVQIQGIIEQQGGLDSYSELTVELRPDGMRSQIRARVSEADRALHVAAHIEVRQWMERLAGGKVVEIVCDVSSNSSTASQSYNGNTTPWFGHDEALLAVTTADGSGVFSRYEVAYGAFEHEACTHPIGRGGAVPVSLDLEVVELPGVHVVGPGAFARLGAANPALTIIALSRWLGDHLSGS